MFGAHHPRGDVFFSGVLCGNSSHQGRDDHPFERQGLLHVLQSGSVRVLVNGREHHRLDRPGLILMGQPTPHEIETPQGNANLVCAQLQFPNPGPTPALLGLPDCLVLPFDQMPGLDGITSKLFSEAFETRPGKRTAVNLLVDLLLLMVLRHCQAHDLVRPGVLAALGDPRIARVVGQLNKRPEEAWSVERQAELAGMSRASFAARFRQLVGASPADFLQTIRLDLAFELLGSGQSLQSVADRVGYRSTTALARALQKKHGVSPRAVRGGLPPLPGA